MINGSAKIKYALYGQKIENFMEIKMEYNKEIVKTAVRVIKKFRKVKEDDDGIIASQANWVFNGDRDSAADDIVNDIHQCTELVMDNLYDETVEFIQALLNAEIAGYYVQDNGVYKTREEYISGDNNAKNEYYAKLNNTLQNLIEEVNTEMKKGTE